MFRILLTIGCVVAVAGGGAAGCAGGNRKPKPSARIYTGDAPSISMTGRQRVGEDPIPY
jgi:hypothetical protein